MPDGGNSIVVKVNNLCPDAGNPLCAYPVGELFFSLSSFLVGFFWGSTLGVVIGVAGLRCWEDY